MANGHIHHYQTQVRWTGNLGTGTSSYRGYGRSHDITVTGKPTIFGSSDPSFRGEPTRYNPEELLVASLSSCHMLWYLHLCSEASIVVTDYMDQAVGTMAESKTGSGHFTEVILNPEVSINIGSDPELAKQLAKQLHEKAHHLCFIANSVNFPVRCNPIVTQANGAEAF